MMAQVRTSTRTFGKSDPIDALAVARAALREPNLPVARLDGPDRRSGCSLDHRESLVAERTRAICRLRWHLHELDPGWEPNARTLDLASAFDQLEAHLADVDRIDGADGMNRVVARLARVLVARPATSPATSTSSPRKSPTSSSSVPRRRSPCLAAVRRPRPRSSARPPASTASAPRTAYARYNGTAPLPVWSSNRPHHRLSRTGNRQLNAALHRIAMTQAHCHPPARAMIDRPKQALTADWKPYESSNAASPTSSTQRHEQT